MINMVLFIEIIEVWELINSMCMLSYVIAYHNDQTLRPARLRFTE